MLITDLPTEIIQQILDHLSDHDLFNTVSCCNRLNVFPVKRWQHREQEAFSKKPLDYWIRNGNLKAVKFLFPEGKEITEIRKTPNNALTWGCYFGQLDIIKFLTEERHISLTVNHMHWAIIMNVNLQIIDYLYNKLAPLDYFDLQFLVFSNINRRKDIVLLCYLHEIAKVSIPAICIDHAVEYGNLSALKYLQLSIYF